MWDRITQSYIESNILMHFAVQIENIENLPSKSWRNNSYVPRSREIANLSNRSAWNLSVQFSLTAKYWINYFSRITGVLRALIVLLYSCCSGDISLPYLFSVISKSSFAIVQAYGQNSLCLSWYIRLNFVLGRFVCYTYHRC